MSREQAQAWSLGPSLRDYFKLYVLTVGRRLLAMRQTRAALVDGEEAASVLPSLDALIRYDEGLVVRERLWRQQRQQGTTRPEAKRIDPHVDRQLGVIYQGAGLSLEGLDPVEDADLLQQGQAMLSQLFPDTVGAITRLPYDEELEVVRHLVKAMTGAWHDTVKALGLERQVARLSVLANDYARALSVLPEELITFKALRAERWLGHEMMLGVVVQILAAYHAPQPEVVAKREALLAPLKAQNARVADYLRRRRKIADIDPDTGEELEPDELSEPLDDGASDLSAL